MLLGIIGSIQNPSLPGLAVLPGRACPQPSRLSVSKPSAVAGVKLSARGVQRGLFSFQLCELVCATSQFYDPKKHSGVIFP